VSAHGDGQVRLSAVDAIEAIAHVGLHGSVAKDVDISPDGRRLAAVCAQSRVLHVVELEAPYRETRIAAVPSARLSWLDDGRVVLAPYGRGLSVWREGTTELEVRLTELGRFVDLERDGDRRGLTALSDHGDVVRLGLDLDPVLVTRRERAVAVAGQGDTLLVLSPRSLALLEDGRLEREIAVEPHATEVALAPDRTAVAVGFADGTVGLWSVPSLEPLAVLVGHSGRISALAFDPERPWLVSGGWDGELRQWSLHSLVRPGAELLPDLEAQWGRTLDESLARTSGVLPRASTSP